MSVSSVNNMLQQFEALKSQASGGIEGRMPLDNTQTQAPGNEFQNILKQSLDRVNEMHQESGDLTRDFVLGRTNDLPKVMIAQQKASIASTAMIEVRNKLLDAYREVMNMPV